MIYVALGSNCGDVMISQEIRRDVFVKEGGRQLEEELDGLDDTSRHIIVYYNYAPAGCCRLRVQKGGVVLDRFAMLNEYRGLGLSYSLINYATEYIDREKLGRLSLFSPVECIAFFEKLGFRKDGDIDEVKNRTSMVYINEKDI